MNVIEVLSDSSTSSLDGTVDGDDMMTIMEKYEVYDEKTSESIEKLQRREDDEFPDIGSTLTAKKNTPTSSGVCSSISFQDLLNKYKNSKENVIVSDIYDTDKNETEPAKKRQKVTMSKEQKMMEKAQKQAEKQKQKELKKEEVKRQKQIKEALREAHKSIKPEECMKYIKVCIDVELVNESYGSHILTVLQSNDINYNVESQIIPNSVTWKRKVQSHLIDEDGKLMLSQDCADTNEVLVFKHCNEIIDLIRSKMLVSHVQNMQELIPGKRIFLAIYGIKNYYRLQKTKKQKELREGNQKEDKQENVPNITSKNIEFALTELQLLCSCCHRFVDSTNEVDEIILQYTKSIAQIPYKLEKHQKYEKATSYMQGDNKDCVQVDKLGNGLKRLWQQQLTTFSLASLETAEAIISKYPTPHLLLKAYEKCTSKIEGEQLLQDIPIRRAAGPLTTVKKIGPELSKKMYTFFTSKNSEDTV